MPGFLVIALGVVVTLAVLADVARTVFSSEGAGWLTSGTSRCAWRLLLALRPDNRRPRWLNASGPLVVLLIGSLWVLGLWLGFGLVLAGGDAPVIRGSTGEVATASERAYFAGYAISTMGNGEFQPGGGAWRLLTVIYSLLGFGLLTAIISYFLPVLSAVIRQEKLSVAISILGRSPTDLLRRAWDGSGFPSLDLQAPQLQDMILHHGRSYLAYPVIQCFANAERRVAVVLNLAILDEAIGLILLAGRDGCPRKPEIKLLRSAMDAYLETIKSLRPSAGDSDVVEIRGQDLAGLDEVIDAGRAEEAAGSPVIRRRRELWARLLRDSGWKPEDVMDRS